MILPPLGARSFVGCHPNSLEISNGEFPFKINKGNGELQVMRDVKVLHDEVI